MPDDDRIGWSCARSSGAVRIRFLGRSACRDVSRLGELLGGDPPSLAWLRQVHSSRVLEAGPGVAGEGDALVTPRRGLALAIATADCVPVLFATSDRIGAAHAGWRGLVGGVLASTLARLEATPDQTEAWIGPAIGACCYEVGDDVAEQIARASAADVVATPAGRKAHVDLQAAAIHQLRSSGVERIHRIELCTKCNQQLLWSYRGQGDEAGRNWAMIWRQP